MDFVDEQNYFTIGACNFVDDSFQTLLEFTFIFGTCHQRAHVERINLLGAQVFGYVATYYTVCQTFGYGSLAGARFADKHGVVFCTAAENLQHTSYLFVASDYRVELARAGAFVEVYSIFAQSVIGFFGALVGSLLALAQFVDGRLEFFFSKAGILKN